MAKLRANTDDRHCRRCCHAGDVILKYLDKDNDYVTVTNRSDVQAALTEALRHMDKRLGIIPPIKVQVVPATDKVRELCTLMQSTVETSVTATTI